MARIVTFGEAMIRLAPPRNLRIEQTTSFDVEVGGAELNCGVGLARLGHAVDWVSVLPDNALGRLIRNRVRLAGVNDRFVQFSEAGRCGVNFLEIGSPPRASEVLYDRAGSSISLAEPSVYDWPTILDCCDWFHVTGITPALSDRAALAVREALQEANRRSIPISFDLNYRSKLWSVDQARKVLTTLISNVDLLVASPGDARQLFDISESDFASVAKQMTDRFTVKAVASIEREQAGRQFERLRGVAWQQGQLAESKWYDVETVDRIGSGDAFAAGLIDGLIRNEFTDAVETAAAMAALKHTIPGDLPLVSRDDVKTVKAGGSMRVKR